MLISRSENYIPTKSHLGPTAIENLSLFSTQKEEIENQKFSRLFLLLFSDAEENGEADKKNLTIILLLIFSEQSRESFKTLKLAFAVT